MKAEKEMNWPPSKDWNVYVILGRGRRTYLYTGVSRSRADQVVKAFNSALSAHVVKEAEQLQTEIDRLKKEVERLEFMIEHGLGPEDMVNDIIMPHEI